MVWDKVRDLLWILNSAVAMLPELITGSRVGSNVQSTVPNLTDLKCGGGDGGLNLVVRSAMQVCQAIIVLMGVPAADSPLNCDAGMTSCCLQLHD